MFFVLVPVSFFVRKLDSVPAWSQGLQTTLSEFVGIEFKQKKKLRGLKHKTNVIIAETNHI